MDFPSHVVITGASGSIGAALAKIYAKPGVHLSLFGRREKELVQLADECKNLLATVSVYCIDVTNIEELQNKLNEIDSKKPVDLVIANAGIANYLSAEYEEESWCDTKKLLDVNVIGAFATVSPLITRMRQRKSGQIAFMSSMAAYYGLPVCPSYSASKAALKTYGEALRGLLKNDDVKVSVIFPGFVQSDMCDQFLCNKPFLMTPDKAAKIIQRGLQKNKARIAFPFLLNLGLKFLSIFPCAISEFILLKLGYGVIRKEYV